jgi:hypothetical protein
VSTIKFLDTIDSKFATILQNDLIMIGKMIPSERDLRKLDKLNPELKQQFYEEFNEALQSVPTKKQIENIIPRLEKLRGDPTALDNEIMQIETELRQNLNNVRRQEKAIDDLTLIHTGEESEESEPESEESEPAATSERSEGWRDPMYKAANKEQKRAYISRMINENKDKLNGVVVPVEGLKRGFILGKSSLGSLTNDELDKVHDAILGILAKPMQSESEEAGLEPEIEVEGKGMRKMRMRGRGLAKPRSNRLAHLTEGVVEKPKPYIPFGRYVIHRYDLEKGKLNIKTPKGGVIKELPSQKISLNLGKVLHSIGQGIMPEYDKVDSLKDEDKEVLHKVIHHSRMGDRVSVPTPKSKTEEEKISDRFNILKGEIIAGNDNPKIVKELKALLMRLINAGRIPRREAHEILTDLASLGI